MNDIPFLTSLSEYAHYGTAGAVDNMKCIKLEKKLQNIIQSYVVHGFRIVLAIVDT